MNLKFFQVLSILILQDAWVMGQSNVERQDTLPNNCMEIKQETRVTYPGWPFHLDCQMMVDGSSEDLSQCYVFHNNSLIKTSSQQFRLNSSRTFSVYLINSTDERCWSRNLTIELRSLANGSVFGNINSDYQSNKSVTYFEMQEHYPMINFDCLPPSNVAGEPPYYLALPPTYNVTWWRTQRFRNGSLSPDKNRNYTEFTDSLNDAEIVSRPPSPQSIQKRQLNYFDPALYSCQLQYKDEFAFIAHQSLCVWTPEVDTSPPTILCTDNISFKEGEDVRVECSAFTSNMKIQPGQLIVQWRRESSSNPDCEYRYESSDAAIPSDERYSCLVETFNNLDPTCFDYVPSDYEIEKHPDRKSFKVIFYIRNVKRNDGGKYHVSVNYANGTGEYDFILEFNRQEHLRKIVIILVSVLAVLIFISLAVMVVWCYWIQIQLFIRRHMGKYDEDGKEYVAILSYVYSNDMPEVTRERTRKIVHCVQEKMKDMNYSFYDSHRDFDQGSTVENLLKYLNESHRMIVILTDAYVDERWTRFEAQQGFLNMLKNRTKLIFIRTPGARKALRKCKRKGDDFSSELVEAMKASRNIRWTEKMSETRFKDHVQYALPNLKRAQNHSGSAGQFVKFENFDRSDSQFTQVSVLSGFSARSSDGDEEMAFRESRDFIV